MASFLLQCGWILLGLIMAMQKSAKHPSKPFKELEEYPAAYLASLSPSLQKAFHKDIFDRTGYIDQIAELFKDPRIAHPEASDFIGLPDPTSKFENASIFHSYYHISINHAYAYWIPPCFIKPKLYDSFKMQIAAVMLTQLDDVHSRFFLPVIISDYLLAAWHGKVDETGGVEFGRLVRALAPHCTWKFQDYFLNLFMACYIRFGTIDLEGNPFLRSLQQFLTSNGFVWDQLIPSQAFLQTAFDQSCYSPITIISVAYHWGLELMEILRRLPPAKSPENFYAGPISRMDIAKTFYHTITVPSGNLEPLLSHEEQKEETLPLEPIVEAEPQPTDFIDLIMADFEQIWLQPFSEERPATNPTKLY